jgi:hypothetical protein
VTLIIIMITRRVSRKRKAAERKGPDQAAGKDRSGKELGRDLESARDDADLLASKGRYAEAVHALLLRGLDAFRKRDRNKVPAHLTSRELLPALPLNAAEDSSLRELIFMTELSWFGNVPLGEREYKSSRMSFGKLIRSVTPGSVPAGTVAASKPAAAASSSSAASAASSAPATPPASATASSGESAPDLGRESVTGNDLGTGSGAAPGSAAAPASPGPDLPSAASSEAAPSASPSASPAALSPGNASDRAGSE